MLINDQMTEATRVYIGLQEMVNELLIHPVLDLNRVSLAEIALCLHLIVLAPDSRWFPLGKEYTIVALKGIINTHLSGMLKPEFRPKREGLKS